MSEKREKTMSVNESPMETTKGSKTFKKKRNRLLAGIGVFVIAAAAFAATLSMTPNDESGAAFSDDTTIPANIAVGATVIKVSENGGPAEIDFSNLAGDGTPSSQLVTVVNDLGSGSTLPFRASVCGAEVTSSTGDTTGLEESLQFRVKIDPERDGTFQPKMGWTDYAGLPNSLTLFDLDAGESGDVQLEIRLVDPPNSLQGVTVTGVVDFCADEVSAV